MDLNTHPDHDVQPPPFPALTIVATFLLLLLFAALVGMIYYYSNRLDVVVTTVSGEQKLAELVADEKALTTMSGYDKTSNTVRIPVDMAVQKMVEEGNRNGKLPFPLPAKKEVPKTETMPSPKEVPAEKPKTPEAKIPEKKTPDKK